MINSVFTWHQQDGVLMMKFNDLFVYLQNNSTPIVHSISIKHWQSFTPCLDVGLNQYWFNQRGETAKRRENLLGISCHQMLVVLLLCEQGSSSSPCQNSALLAKFSPSISSCQHSTPVFLVTIGAICGTLQVLCVMFAIRRHINKMVRCLDWLTKDLDVFDLTHTGSATRVLGCPPDSTF